MWRLGELKTMPAFPPPLPPKAIRYIGDRTQLDAAAEAQLTAAVPPGSLLRKAQGLFEVTLPADQAEALQLPAGWLLYQPTYAEIDVPRISLEGLQKRLEQLRKR